MIHNCHGSGIMTDIALLISMWVVSKSVSIRPPALPWLRLGLSAEAQACALLVLRCGCALCVGAGGAGPWGGPARLSGPLRVLTD